MGAQLSISTFSGAIDSDFPITLRAGEHGIGAAQAKRLNFTLGQGTARIIAETFSGDDHPLVHRAPTLGAPSLPGDFAMPHPPHPRRSAPCCSRPAALVAQDRQTEANAFTLNERVPAGQWIRVRNVNGEVRVRPSTSDRVEITATKTWRRGDPKDVRIESYKASDGSILVCAFWTENATCDENGYQSHNDGWRARPEQRRRGGLRGPRAEGREGRRLGR